MRKCARMWRCAIQACGRSREPDVAMEILDEAELELIDEPHALVGVYGAAMDALSGFAGRGGAAERSSEQCLQLLQRMREAGASPDMGAYGSALHACRRDGDWQAVYNLLYTMRAEGLLVPGSTMQPIHKTLWKRAKKELGIRG